MSLLQLPAKLSTPFLTGNGIAVNRFSNPTSSISLTQTRSHPFPAIKAVQTMQGKVVCTTNNKTVAVEVTRLATDRKYKKLIRIKKKYQAHDPENGFKVGDIVQLHKIKPISKNKCFLALPAPARNSKKGNSSGELDIPLQSQQEGEKQSKD
ncbi:unnamed protein product [Vicia faba]|uniref:30S ribosomal protein S17, chloroplastic n=1 Tax=Vicia faba TaxID=3906 RepID=A0AAV1AND4_VICFA|nr:unnamed protein product [Vicia faba]